MTSPTESSPGPGTIEKLMAAEEKALHLFNVAEERGLIVAGKSESELNTEVFALAKELFGIEKYWHKRIVRSGPNTLLPYNENPPDLVIQPDDLLFFDFGPIFEDWEADFGRTYVIGGDPYKQKMKKDIESAWFEARGWFDRQAEDWLNKQTALTGADFYEYVSGLAGKYGWTFGGEIAGHLIGRFPHERLAPGDHHLYVHPGNHNNMFLPDSKGDKRHWILEIHFVDAGRQIGGFFEQLLA